MKSNLALNFFFRNSHSLKPWFLIYFNELINSRIFLKFLGGLTKYEQADVNQSEQE